MKPALGAVLLIAASPLGAADRAPILDMHMHALAADEQGPPPLAMCTPFAGFDAWDQRRPYREQFLQRLREPPCPDPVWSPMTDDEVRSRTLAVMERLNVIGVLSGPADRVEAWRRTRPERFIPAVELSLEPGTTPERLRELRRGGRLEVLGEVTTQYLGVAPDDPRLEPYWALAEELDIPVAIHVGTGPPGAIYLGAEGYRARLHSALTMEEVLVRHPRLRVYLSHAGYPMIDDLLALLYAHPQVHLDVGVIVYTQPRPAFYRYLERIVEAGFESRIMFGSDQMVWPETIERAIRVIEEAPFLSEAQKRAILYDNAARFLRLGAEQRALHQRLGRD
ncbi:MAG TPA: amidohydrolase family protein [Allosphingosinicella sp.]|nr:amidohydrolase family protein [Allosphingosinicella sp.]